MNLYLSRRNLLTLIAKLDAAKRGEPTLKTIIKNDTKHPAYPQTIGPIFVVAVEDNDYYVDRNPGHVLHYEGEQ